MELPYNKLIKSYKYNFFFIKADSNFDIGKLQMVAQLFKLFQNKVIDFNYILYYLFEAYEFQEFF